MSGYAEKCPRCKQKTLICAEDLVKRVVKCHCANCGYYVERKP